MIAQFIAALLILAGFSAGLVGAVDLLTGAWNEAWSPAAFFGGLFVGISGIFLFFFQGWGVAKEQRVRARDPKRLFASWTDARGREILFARNGLFVGRRFYGFGVDHSEIVEVKRDGTTLCVRVVWYKGSEDAEREKHAFVEIPPEHDKAVRKGIRRVNDVSKRHLDD